MDAAKKFASAPAGGGGAGERKDSVEAYRAQVVRLGVAKILRALPRGVALGEQRESIAKDP